MVLAASVDYYPWTIKPVAIHYPAALFGAMMIISEGLQRIELLYALCLLLAVSALIRMNRRFDQLDRDRSRD